MKINDRWADIAMILAVVAIIVLKIVNVITIPWLWLTAIIWVPLLFGCGLAVCVLIIFAIYLLIRRIKEHGWN